MKIWTRSDTKEWIHQLENRIEDIDYYLKKTIEWCEEREIHDDRSVLILNFITVIWVSWMRNEPISYVELMDILGLPHMVVGDDRLYSLGEKFYDLDHEQMLEIVLRDLGKDDYFPS